MMVLTSKVEIAFMPDATTEQVAKIRTAIQESIQSALWNKYDGCCSSITINHELTLQTKD